MDLFHLKGQVHNYKGIGYRMNNLSLYECVNLPPNDVLNGMFTSTVDLHNAIDALENRPRLANNKPLDKP